ncbi:glycosyltransferase family 1 protein [Curtobacterium sp. RHCKG23]|uniref:Glycosyltransferase family 1 protein n=1 Tax=Curtobacterium citri TaxID=3055139 RepID=A0ABT7T9F9_9MICO|nr:glycosyltransferase family 1 protein [Curtobacterium citri]MDM7886170.1 glycosyltransferase family 1 protein [Curtobacterium citri]
MISGLLEAWSEYFPNDELHVVVKDRSAIDLPKVTVHEARWPLHPLNNLFGLKELARNVGAEVVFSQNFWARAKVPSFTFVHDVLFLSNPEWFSWKERLYFSLIPFGMQRAAGVFTSSATEKRRMLDRVRGVRFVESVGLASAPALSKAEAVAPRGITPGNFLICVGRLNERKNLRRVIAGFLRMRNEHTAAPSLFVVGPADGLKANDFMADSDAVRFLGPVSDGELRWLYENARGLIFGSLDEGFGLPPVEALSFGCPVAVSDIPVMHEVVGSAATYFDPRDIGSIAASISVLADSSREVPGRALGWDSVVKRVRGVICEKI